MQIGQVRLQTLLRSRSNGSAILLRDLPNITSYLCLIAGTPLTHALDISFSPLLLFNSLIKKRRESWQRGGRREEKERKGKTIDEEQVISSGSFQISINRSMKFV